MIVSPDDDSPLIKQSARVRKFTLSEKICEPSHLRWYSLSLEPGNTLAIGGFAGIIELNS